MNNAFDLGTGLKEGWDAFAREAVALIVGAVVVGILGTFSLGLLIGPLTVAYCGMCIKAVRGERVEIGDVFSEFRRFVPTFLLMLLMVLAITIGTILCIIPGLALGVLLAWAPFYMAAGEDDAMAAMRKSWDLTMHNLGPALIFLIVAYLINMVGSSLGGVGAFVTMPLSYAMLASGFIKAAGAWGESGLRPGTETPGSAPLPTV